MRLCIGIVSAKIVSSKPGHCASRSELMPRSDSARLIDFVKFSGVVVGSRRSDMQVSRPVLSREQIMISYTHHHVTHILLHHRRPEQHIEQLMHRQGQPLQ